jgi:hypothetical protein
MKTTDTDYLLNDLAAWMRRRLETLEHRATGNPYDGSQNGGAVAIIPEWELRQKLEAIENLKTSAEGRRE